MFPELELCAAKAFFFIAEGREHFMPVQK